MYIRVQHEEFEMIYAPLCFAKSMIISWKLTVGEKIYNVFLDEAIQWMMDERGIEVMARLSKGWKRIESLHSITSSMGNWRNQFEFLSFW